ncbi:unnamed protein product [Ectocarpus sp. 12 AP-2014]
MPRMNSSCGVSTTRPCGEMMASSQFLVVFVPSLRCSIRLSWRHSHDTNSPLLDDHSPPLPPPSSCRQPPAILDVAVTQTRRQPRSTTPAALARSRARCSFRSIWGDSGSSSGASCANTRRCSWSCW